MEKGESGILICQDVSQELANWSWAVMLGQDKVLERWDVVNSTRLQCLDFGPNEVKITSGLIGLSSTNGGDRLPDFEGKKV